MKKRIELPGIDIVVEDKNTPYIVCAYPKRSDELPFVLLNGGKFELEPLAWRLIGILTSGENTTQGFPFPISPSAKAAMQAASIAAGFETLRDNGKLHEDVRVEVYYRGKKLEQRPDNQLDDTKVKECVNRVLDKIIKKALLDPDYKKGENHAKED